MAELKDPKLAESPSISSADSAEPVDPKELIGRYHKGYEVSDSPNLRDAEYFSQEKDTGTGFRCSIFDWLGQSDMARTDAAADACFPAFCLWSQCMSSICHWCPQPSLSLALPTTPAPPAGTTSTSSSGAGAQAAMHS